MLLDFLSSSYGPGNGSLCCFFLYLELQYYNHWSYTTTTTKSFQLCPTLCDPIDSSPLGSPCPWDSPGKNTGVGCHFLLQCMKVKSLSHVWLFVTPWTAAYQAPPSMGFPRQEYWSGVPLPSPIYNQIFDQLYQATNYHYFYQRLSHTFGNANNFNKVEYNQ